MLIRNGFVFCDDGVFRKLDICTQGSYIHSLGQTMNVCDPVVVNADGCYVIPGLVDIHIHGAVGADFSDGTEAAIGAMSRYLLSQGVTSFLGTSMALPGKRLSEIYLTARNFIGACFCDQATLRGINMEGPFFSTGKRGAQNPDYIVPPNFALFQRLYEIAEKTFAPLQLPRKQRVH